MIQGYPCQGLGEGFGDKHIDCLKGLLNRDGKAPKFIAKIFHHFSNNTNKVIINIRTFEYDTITHPRGHKQYGYSAFKGIFCAENEDGFNMRSLIYLFPYLQSFIIYCYDNGSYKESINLNSAFIDDVYKTIDLINNSRNLKTCFKQIIIVKPSTTTPVHSFINKEQDKLSKIGWKAMKKTFNHDRFGKCDDSMYIYPL